MATIHVSSPGDSATTTTPRGHSWAARFGRVILQAGVAAIPHALFMHQAALGLFAPDIWFISYILAHKWDADLPYPSLNQMARETGVSLRQIQKLREGLVARQYLVVRERYDAIGRRTTNGYDFAPLFGVLEALVHAGAPVCPPIQEDGPLPLLSEESADTSFVARYGRVIARAGIAAIPCALFTYQAQLGLSPQQVWFVSYILAHKWDTALPYPSLKKMAARTGYSLSQIHEIKTTLVKAGYLRLVGRRDDQGGQAPSAYDFSALLDTVIHHLGGVVDPTPNSMVGVPAHIPLAAVPRRKGQRCPPPALAVSDRSEQTDALPPVMPAPLPIALAPPPPDPPTSIPLRAASPRAANPGSGGGTPPPPLPSPPRGNTGPHSPYLDAVITDLSRELHDSTHSSSNVTQAHRLWHRLHTASGMTDETFGVDIVQVARRRTRRAQGAQGSGQIENKMAYFFEVLRNLVDQQMSLQGRPVIPAASSTSGCPAGPPL